MNVDFSLPCTARKCVLWLNEPFAIIRTKTEATAQFAKLAIRTIRGVGLLIASHAAPVLRFKAVLMEVEAFTDFFLIFDTIQALFSKDGWKEPSTWFFAGASTIGVFLFLHHITLIDLGEVGLQMGGSAACGFASAGFLADVVASAQKVKNPFTKKGRTHKNALQILKVFKSTVNAAFYGAVSVRVVPKVVTVPLGIVAAGMGLGCILYKEIGEKVGVM